jgi:carbon storage regulator
MLVLSRKIGEQIVVGDNVRVMVVGVRGGKVRLGVIAPPEVPVHRAEVYRQIELTRCWADTNGRAADCEVAGPKQTVPHCA